MFAYSEAYNFFLQILFNDQIKSIKTGMFMVLQACKLFPPTEIKSNKKKTRKTLWKFMMKQRGFDNDGTSFQTHSSHKQTHLSNLSFRFQTNFVFLGVPQSFKFFLLCP